MNQQLTLETFLPLLPIMITGLTSVIVMLAIAFRRHHWWNATLTVMGLNAALVSTVWLGMTQHPQLVTPLLVVDPYAYFYMGIILVATLACCTLSHAYIEGYTSNKEELYLLITIAAVGAMVLACSVHMASFFIGLELLSVPVYGMVAYTSQRSRSLEAGIKYLVLSATASAFILFGMAMLYSQSGSLSFLNMLSHLMSGVHKPLAILGVGMILIGVGFKLSLAPFHLWTPDVYEGAPAPVAAFLATVSKAAVFIVVIRLLLQAGIAYVIDLQGLLTVLAILSIVVGNLLALTQTNLKRMFGYSSIAHFGYLLIAVICGAHATMLTQNPAASTTAIGAVNIYLLTYVLTSLGAFGVITLMSSPYKGQDADGLHHYRGLFWQRPYLTAVMTIMMLSMAGIPLTAGFIGKFFIFLNGVQNGMWGLLAALIFGSALGLYYYLRVMVTLFMATPGMKRYDAEVDWGEKAGGLMVIGVAGLVLLVGIYPEPMLQLAYWAVR